MYNFNQEEFDNATGKDFVTCWCTVCGSENKRLKVYIKNNIKHNVDNFDCHSCKELERQKIIENNTKVCPTCEVSFFSYENRFCSSSCSAIFNNKKRKKRFSCIRCDKELTYKHKYCSEDCSGKDRSEKRFKEIEEKVLKGETISQNIESNNTFYKRYLIKKHGPKCMKCGWSEKNPFSGRVPIELEHKDGNCINNSLDNLELLCPNCHSLSQFYKGANKRDGGSPRYKQWKKYFSSK